MLRKAVKGVVIRAFNAYDKKDGGPGSLPCSLWDLDVDARGELLWEGCSLPELAREYGTPLYVISKARLEKDYRAFLGAFTKRYAKVEVGYSYKTNPLPGVIKVLHEFGASAEVISHFELWLALRLGVPPQSIIMNGPGKTPDGLDLAVQHGIRLINVDNVDEIAAVDRLAGQYGIRQSVGIRVVTSVGWAAQFGLRISTGDALEAFRRASTSANLIPCALHAHLGTGIRDAQVYFQAVSEMLAFAQLLRDKLGIQIRYLDFGGGFGVPTVRPLSEMDTKLIANGFSVSPPREGQAPTPDDYAEGIVSRLADYYDLAAEDAPGLVLEPGRAITSSAQCLLVSVLALKPGDRFSDYVIADGGKNITMPLGYEYHEAFLANRMKAPPEKRYSVFGPLCHPGDVLFRHRDFAEFKVGDVIAVMDAGAYFVPNQMNFSNARPAAVLVSNGGASLIRARESFEAMVQLDRL